MIVLWMVIGAVLGGIAWSSSMGGVLVGAALGLLWGRQQQLARQLRELRAKLGAAPAERQGPAPVAAEPKPQTSDEPWWVTEAQVRQRDLPTRVEPPQQPAKAVERPAPQARAEAAPSAIPRSMPRAVVPREPSLIDRTFQRIWRWFTEGNVPVKIGMLVLFAGVAALLKYASDSGMLRVPVGLRVALVALAAIAALAFGWRKRQAQRVFALSLQGGAIGVLLITVFAAFRLYDLLPAGAAFALLIVLVAGVGVLAVMQDALALAVLGLVAGFAAPILVSTGSGSHVALFSYYTVLNLAILGIAWRRSWRVLNLLGFVATYAVGTAWGVLRYEPALFASTEPFLVLNFLFYLAIPWLHVLRAPADRRVVIDGCLMFGNPLISLLLQGALLRWDGTGLAISALVAAAVYLLAAYVGRRQPAMRLLYETWAVLAVAFATLAVPLALSADVTGSIFALEGAGLIWLGLRQPHALARWSGLSLQLFAALALLMGRWGHGYDAMLPLLNREFVSALLLVAAAFISSYLYARHGEDGTTHRLLAVLFYGWGLAWWVLASGMEIQRFVPTSWLFAAWLGWLAFTAWGTAEVAHRRPPHELGTALTYSPVLGMAIMLPLLLWAGMFEQQPLHGWNLLAVLVAGVLGWRSLICLREVELAASLAQLAWLWRWILLGVIAIALALDRLRWLSHSWLVLLGAAPLLLAFALIQWRPRWIAPPLAVWLPRWRPPLQYSLLAVLGLLGVWALFQPGDAAPLRYLPLLNPLELLMLGIVVSMTGWLTAADTPGALKRLRAPVLGGVAFALVTSATLRAVHQLAGVPWDDALADSSLAQMSLTVVWSVLGLLAWVWGSRHGQRLLWLAGAVIMGVVLTKLILVDRSHLGNLFGIGSFIAYGLLCSVIGYLAPAPPRRSSSTEEPRHAP
ncbi:DUF2339 domain-containing protein [Dyella sp. RRB7]|uniref:DUF2339 domain-containing protein n=1 Tax=Dyella sp. RRB7 TaxID=2919502 RepID=UPI001FA9FEC6|nr:DUF2339 domain-containing protein [Dyella sp. RRB7]